MPVVAHDRRITLWHDGPQAMDKYTQGKGRLAMGTGGKAPVGQLGRERPAVLAPGTEDAAVEPWLWEGCLLDVACYAWADRLGELRPGFRLGPMMSGDHVLALRHSAPVGRLPGGPARVIRSCLGAGKPAAIRVIDVDPHALEVRVRVRALPEGCG